MVEVTSTIYQSGQTAPHEGIYEVVGVNQATALNKSERAVRTMRKGEVFPIYQGWEVCWRFSPGKNIQESRDAATERRLNH